MVGCLWEIWQQMAGMFPGKWVRENGAAPLAGDGQLTAAGEIWLQVLTGLYPKQIAAGLATCLTSALEWPPNPGRFRALCLGIPALAEVEYELRPYRLGSAFTLLVRSTLDQHAYNIAASGYQQRQILIEAYDRAVKHVMDGGALPELREALPPQRCAPLQVRDRGAAREAMARAATDLGFGGGHDAR
ncbi:hypothetical protein [uncultured Stenotrophomonas sp.]|uniref:hypothetical protein n=1 Tax=uncultured Stenotrophomonas sp. TaxID=165438 RepID=UPI0025D79515|nr:hypothetical protein [uncultured Stenotrophomonas sp.]